MATQATSGKAKRLRRNPRALLAPSTLRGKILGPPARLLKQEELITGGLPALPSDDPVLTPWHAAGARLLILLRPMAPPPDAIGDGLLGLWVVGARRLGSLLDSEDVKALEQIALQAAVLLDYDRLHWREAAELRRSARFRRYFSPQVADLISSEGKDIATHRRELTVLFADLRGFSALAETAQPEEIVAHLNDCLRTVAEVIFEHGGTLDKHLGNGVMAFFGASKGSKSLAFLPWKRVRRIRPNQHWRR